MRKHVVFRSSNEVINFRTLTVLKPHHFNKKFMLFIKASWSVHMANINNNNNNNNKFNF